MAKYEVVKYSLTWMGLQKTNEQIVNEYKVGNLVQYIQYPFIYMIVEFYKTSENYYKMVLLDIKSLEWIHSDMEYNRIKILA